MRGRPPKRKNERFKAPTYSNGDTKLELLTRTKRALTQSREKWSDKTAERMKILFQEEPGSGYSDRFQTMILCFLYRERNSLGVIPFLSLKARLKLDMLLNPHL